MQKSLWDSTKKTFYPLALIFTIGHWLGAIKIRFGYIRLARRTVSSAFKSQAANIVFVTPPEAKNSNSVGLYHQGLARNKCLTCKNCSGIPPKNILSPGPNIYHWEHAQFYQNKYKINPNNNKDIFSSHFSSYVQPKTILLQYKSIVFGWTYELKFEERIVPYMLCHTILTKINKLVGLARVKIKWP